MIGLGLSVVQIAVRQLLGFDPKSLFAASEPGVWYDPSDFSTMFQDAAGTTPVTAVEQPVGLILDKSKGVALGSELRSSGAVGLVGTATVATYNTSTGVGSVSRVDGANQSFVQWSGLSTNYYVVTISCTSGVAVSVRSGSQSGTTITTVLSGASTVVYLTPSSNLITVTSSSGTASFTLSSIRELPGFHATQTTSTSRPVLSARYNLLTKTEQFDDAAWGKLQATSATPVVTKDQGVAPDGATTASRVDFGAIDAATDYSVIAQNFTAQQAAYAGGVWVKAWSAGDVGKKIWAYLYDTAVRGLVSVTLTSDWQRLVCSETLSAGASRSFSVGSLGTAFGGENQGAVSTLIWGASLVPANQAALPYQRVNTATDYDADPSKFKPYLRFDGVDDWLVTPTITPGTDKVQVFAGVRKLSDANIGVIAELSAQAGGGNNGTFVLHGQTSPVGYRYAAGSGVSGTAFATDDASVFTAPITSVITGISNFAGATVDDEISVRVNGAVPTQTKSGTISTGSFGNYPLYIGRRGGTTLPFNGHLYGLIVRFGANLPAGTIASTETWLNQRTGAY